MHDKKKLATLSGMLYIQVVVNKAGESYIFVLVILIEYGIPPINLLQRIQG